MKKPFFTRYAIFILCMVCFVTPFILRGARDALRDMKNDVKDWLPSRFRETSEMEWFWEHFAGERFIIVTWPGCTGDASDEVFHLFKKKLTATLPPSKQNVVFPEPASKDVGATWLERPYAFIGDRLGLYSTSDSHFNWGGKQEKWLRGFGGRWYYITPAGELYEFQGSDAPIAVAFRSLLHSVGVNQINGSHLITFDKEDGEWYYNDPSRLQAQLFRSVVSGPDVLRDLTDEESGVLRDNPTEAMKRLKGALFGPDGKQTAFVITLTEAGLQDFHRVLSRGVLGKELGRLYKIGQECGIDMANLHLGGPPVDNVAIDEEGNITLLRLVSLCIVLGLSLSWLCFRSWRATIAVFLTGGIGAALGLSIVGWSGVSADAVMMSMPALVYVLGISGAVHFINYYREAVDEHGLIGAPERALGHAWKPAVLCNITTSIGLLSLYTSEIVPIRKFGIFSAAGVMGTLTLIFFYLPSALQLWPLNLPKVRKREDGAESALDAFLSGYWVRFGSMIIRNHWAVAGGCILLITVTGWGVTRINTSVNLLDLFDSSAKILKDYAWIEENVGMLVPMEVVVKFDPQTLRKSDGEEGEDAEPDPRDRSRLSFLDRMEAVATVQNEIDQHFGEGGSQVVGRTMSAVTFSPKLPTARDGFTKRSALNAGLRQNRSEFLRSDYLRIDNQDHSELWRISLRVAAFKNVDYGEFVQDLRSIVEPVLAAQNARQHILTTIVEQREKPAEGEPRPNYFHVGVVLAEEVIESLKGEARAEKEKVQEPVEKREAPDGKQLVAAPEEAAAPLPAQAATAEVEVDREAVFARTLLASLQAMRVKVSAIPASALADAAAKQLGSCDLVVTIGGTPPALQDALREKTLSQIAAQDFLSTSATIAAPDAEKATTPISAVYTGVVPIVYKAQRTLLDSLIDSTFWSFITITPLMMLVSRNVWAGLVAMLPNALPVLLIFGGMGWAGIRVDIGSMMTASIALGVAVDDTIHYLTWFREELDRLGDRHKAILAAYRRCATPTFQAATISGLGLSIFAFSTFTPTQRFGYLMLTILFAGVVAELVFYPALLAGPMGAVFKPRTKGKPPRDEAAGDSDLDLPQTVPLDSAVARQPAAKRIALLSLGTAFRQFWT